jgi:hypothetical protein
MFDKTFFTALPPGSLLSAICIISWRSYVYVGIPKLNKVFWFLILCLTTDWRCGLNNPYCAKGHGFDPCTVQTFVCMYMSVCIGSGCFLCIICMYLQKKSIKVCIFIRYLESITQATSAYFRLDKREWECQRKKSWEHEGQVISALSLRLRKLSNIRKGKQIRRETKNLLFQAPLCFKRPIMLLVTAACAVVSTLSNFKEGWRQAGVQS